MALFPIYEKQRFSFQSFEQTSVSRSNMLATKHLAHDDKRISLHDKIAFKKSQRESKSPSSRKMTMLYSRTSESAPHFRTPPDTPVSFNHLVSFTGGP